MKKLVIILLIIVIIGTPAYLIYNNQRTQDDFYTQLNAFNKLLSEQRYEEAKLIYDESSDTLKANYNISLDAYTQSLVDEAKNQSSTQESLNLLYTYEEIGYNSTEMDAAKLYYEDLLQSNYIFEKGLEYYNNQEFESAIECFNDVLKYDENYEQAQEYLNTYQQYTLIWKEAKDNDEYGRSPLPNAIAYKDNHMYVVHEFNSSFSILKINTSTYSVLSFPIVSNTKGASISNINIVGEFIFFLVEQKSNDIEKEVNNSVYRISTTGNDLTKIVDCDYTYLISYKDEFYAISKSKGIVKTDYYFFNEEVVAESDDEIISIQLADNGIYYTTDEEDTDMNIQYLYDGETTEEIMKEVNLHYYDYGDDNIIRYDVNEFYEYLYHENMANGSANNNQIFAGDMYKYYGLLNDSVIFTYVGDYQQECIRVRDIKKFRTTYKASKNEISYVPIGICYEIGNILLKSDEGISLTTENMRIETTFPLPHIHNSVLADNEEKMELMGEDDLYSDKSISESDEDSWQYSDENVNISTEKLHLDYADSIVYISHIYTNDYNWLQSKSIDNITNPIESIDNITWAIAAEAYDKEPSLINEDRGVISKDVYVYNDEGLFIPYKEANVIPAEKILSDNVLYVFSEGEIILENYEISNDCIKDVGTLSGHCAIGMVETGHYVVIAAKETTKTNRGLSLYALAKLFKDEGCMSAFRFNSDYLFNIIFNEYAYKANVDSDDVSKHNQILYYSGD